LPALHQEISLEGIAQVLVKSNGPGPVPQLPYVDRAEPPHPDHEKIAPRSRHEEYLPGDEATFNQHFPHAQLRSDRYHPDGRSKDWLMTWDNYKRVVYGAIRTIHMRDWLSNSDLDAIFQNALYGYGSHATFLDRVVSYDLHDDDDGWEFLGGRSLILGLHELAKFRDKRFVVIPLNQGRVHWHLVIIDQGKRVAYFFDTLNNFREDRFGVGCEIVKIIGNTLRWGGRFACVNMVVTEQPESWECGLLCGQAVDVFFRHTNPDNLRIDISGSEPRVHGWTDWVPEGMIVDQFGTTFLDY